MDRLKVLDVLTLEQIREMGNLLQVYKLMNGMDLVDNEELLPRDKVTSRTISGHSKMLRMGRSFKDVKKFSFPLGSIEAWNRLTETIVLARSVLCFKEELDNCRCGAT